MNKKTKDILMVGLGIGSVCFIVYYLLIFVPAQKKQEQFNSTRAKAVTECQQMYETFNDKYAKAKSDEEQMIKAGYGYMIKDDMVEIEKMHSVVNAPNWFEGCIGRVLENWGITN